jgi:hypothetical protein
MPNENSSAISLPSSGENIMAPKNLEECQWEIEHLRQCELDRDAIEVEAIDPQTGNATARLYCQFRAPFRARRQDDPQGKPKMWQYVYSITEAHPARVLHEFVTKHHKMRLVPFLLCSEAHDKMREAQLKEEAEHPSKETAGKIEEEAR